jgi:hypothetical protein
MRLLRIGMILALATAGYADIITLKSGRVINGTYLGGSPREVKVQEGDQVETVEVTQIAKIEFGNGTQAPAPNPDRPVLRRAPSSDGSDDSRPTLRRAPGSDSGDDAPPTLRRDTSSASTSDSRPTLRRDTSSDDDSAPTLRRTSSDAPQILRPDASEPSAASTAASVSQQRSPVEIPAGTNIVVRMIDGVDSDRDTVGTTFHASIDQALTVGGETIIPRGADAVVKLVDNKEAGKLTGRAEMTLSLVSIQYEGKKIDANTQTITKESDARGKSTAKKAGVGAVAGAVLGGVLGGGKGAAVGAAAGAGAGATVEAVSSGPHVKVPSETRLTFILDNPITI